MVERQADNSFKRSPQPWQPLIKPLCTVLVVLCNNEVAEVADRTGRDSLASFPQGVQADAVILALQLNGVKQMGAGCWRPCATS